MTTILMDERERELEGVGEGPPLAHLLADERNIHLSLCGQRIRGGSPIGPFLKCKRCKEISRSRT